MIKPKFGILKIISILFNKLNLLFSFLKGKIIVFKKSAAYLLISLAVLLYLLGLYLLFLRITDFRPVKKIVLAETKNNKALELINKPITLITWNIGYAGLDKNMDFFYDGGKKVRPSITDYQNNLNFILNQLASFNYADFILLQEVDIFSKRSYFSNQYELIRKFLPDYYSAFSKNYDVQFVVMPLYSPMGRVKAGIATFSKYKADEIARYSYSSNFNFPLNLLMLDRCFMVNKFTIDGNKKLYVFNTHNSAFDGGKLSSIELAELRDFILNCYKNGDYVIVGGDFNNNPPYFSRVNYWKNYKKADINSIDEKFLPKGWKIVYDTLSPSNRFVDEPFNINTTKTTTIDFFITSPNIETIYIQAIDMGFSHSDHNPVAMQVILKPNFSLRTQ